MGQIGFIIDKRITLMLIDQLMYIVLAQQLHTEVIASVLAG